MHYAIVEALESCIPGGVEYLTLGACNFNCSGFKAVIKEISSISGRVNVFGSAPMAKIIFLVVISASGKRICQLLFSNLNFQAMI